MTENLIKKIDKKKAELEKLPPMPEEQRQKLDQKFMLEWNYNSNHIEGNTLTYGETELLLIHGEASGDHKMRDYEEMKAHNVAIKYVEECASAEDHLLTEKFIIELNRIILKEPYWKKAETPEGNATTKEIIPGQYKTQPNNVKTKTGETFFFSSVEETPAKMKDLVEWYRADERDEEHPLLIAAKLHYKFVRIHPFDDGNGRVARLLMNYHLIKNGYPPVIVKSDRKEEYYRVLRLADGGDPKPFIQYIANELIWSLNLCIRAASKESIEEDGDWGKRVNMLAKELEFNKKVDDNKARKIDQKKRESAFKNCLILREKFFERFNPFDQFFQDSKMSSLIRWQNGKIISTIDVSNLPINKLKEKIYSSRFKWEVICHAKYNKFKYGANKFSLRASFVIDYRDDMSYQFINKVDEQLESKSYKVSHVLNKNDLQVLTVVAEGLFSRIQSEREQ